MSFGYGKVPPAEWSAGGFFGGGDPSGASRHPAHRRASRFPGTIVPANRGASSKSPRFFCHWQRFGDFPLRRGGFFRGSGLPRARSALAMTWFFTGGRGVRRGTWAPPYKVILYMGAGRGRTPPLRICGEILLGRGGRTGASAPTKYWPPYLKGAAKLTGGFFPARTYRKGITFYPARIPPPACGWSPSL